MIDPRNPEILAWLDDLAPEERLVATYAMALAFPRLRNDRDWLAREKAAREEVNPTPEENVDFTLQAARMSGRLKKAMAA